MKKNLKTEWKNLIIQGFWYFALSWTREIQVFPRNPAKFPQKTRNTMKSARNISKYMSAKHI